MRLKKGEKIEIEQNPSRLKYPNLYVVGILTLPFAVGVIPILIAEYLIRNTKYVITNQRIIKSLDVFWKKEETYANRENIQDIKISEGFWDKFIGVGNVMINTSGSQNYEFVLDFIPNNSELMNEIDGLDY